MESSESIRTYNIGDRVLAANRRATVIGYDGKFYKIKYDEPVFMKDVIVINTPDGKKSEGGLIYEAEFWWFSLMPLEE